MQYTFLGKLNVLNKKSLAVFIAVYFFTVVLLFDLSLAAKNKFCNTHIINNKNKKIALNIEIADNAKSMTKGLMFRKSLERNNGMIFVFRREKKLRFWMKNTYLPLSIAYINRHGYINEILDMKPLDTSILYPSAQPAMYALEMNKGWFKENNITKGSKIILDGCLGK